MKTTVLKSLALAGALATTALRSMTAHAGLIPIDFSTATITVPDALAGALARAGIATGSPTITGRLWFDGATPDTNAAGNIGLYDGTLDSMSFSVGSWFSQSLTHIGMNGDITVRNDTGTGNNVLDQIVIKLTGAGLASNGRFDYSFIDPSITSSINDDNRWVLDQVTITLTQNPPGAALPTVLDSDDLPGRSAWESPTWTTRNIALRFNPDLGANLSVAANLTSLHVPEPGSFVLASAALLGLFAARRRKT